MNSIYELETVRATTKCRENEPPFTAITARKQADQVAWYTRAAADLEKNEFKFAPLAAYALFGQYCLEMDRCAASCGPDNPPTSGLSVRLGQRWLEHEPDRRRMVMFGRTLPQPSSLDLSHHLPG